MKMIYFCRADLVCVRTNNNNKNYVKSTKKAQHKNRNKSEIHRELEMRGVRRGGGRENGWRAENKTTNDEFATSTSRRVVLFLGAHTSYVARCLFGD